MAIVLFDTNILIDAFAGHQAAAAELSGYKNSAISSISWIETACKMNQAEKKELRKLLRDLGIQVIHTEEEIMEHAAVIRGRSLRTPPKVGLPDAIIRATAEVGQRLLITRNPKDFGKGNPFVRVPYELRDGKAINLQPLPPEA